MTEPPQGTVAHGHASGIQGFAVPSEQYGTIALFTAAIIITFVLLDCSHPFFDLRSRIPWVWKMKTTVKRPTTS
jgi:hypothetical protein